jgi:hypothetical protein
MSHELSLLFMLPHKNVVNIDHALMLATCFTHLILLDFIPVLVSGGIQIVMRLVTQFSKSSILAFPLTYKYYTRTQLLYAVLQDEEAVFILIQNRR